MVAVATTPTRFIALITIVARLATIVAWLTTTSPTVKGHPVRTKVLSSLWTGYSKALAVYRHVATQHESEAIDNPSHRPYYN
jgi:hypothetical protein